MRGRLTALLLALMAALFLSVSTAGPALAEPPTPPPAAGTDRPYDGPTGDAVTWVCKGTYGAVKDLFTDDDKAGKRCEVLGDATQVWANKKWKELWDSQFGEFIKAGLDAAKWVIRSAFTFALEVPSIDLGKTGLWSGEATLAGMLTWLGLVFAAAGMMWKLGMMAVTGRVKHGGQAAIGWGENLLLSAVGVTIFGMLLTLGDTITEGLIGAVFDKSSEAYDRIILVLIPTALSNPALVAGAVLVLLLVGFIQMVLIFLRQSAIPIICLLLQVAGGGRTGGDTTRQWAPKLITSGLVIIAYKPILAIIVCVGFSELGSAASLSEWLRGVATMLLSILAPVPLMKIFAPFGTAVGGGMAAGGASGALAAAAGYLGSRSGGGHAGPPGAAGPSSPGGTDGSDRPGRHSGRGRDAAGTEYSTSDDALQQATRVEQSMGSMKEHSATREGGADTPGDASSATVPAQPGALPETPGTVTTRATGSAPAPGLAGVAQGGIQVIDGVNDVSNTVGGGEQA